MARASVDRRRHGGSRVGRPLKVLVGALLVLLVLIILNAFALNNETESARLTVPDAELVPTSAGQLQVLDTGVPETTPEPQGPPSAGRAPGPGMSATQLASRMPVVLIHGSAGAIDWWDDLIPLLEPYHRVVAIDMLGYGGSDKPDSDYSIETQAGLISEVLARLNLTNTLLVGHSLGGKVVTAVAEVSPDLVAGLALLDTAPDNSFGGLGGGARATRTPLLGQALWRVAPDFMIRRNIAQGFAPGYEVPDRFVDDVRAMTYPAYKESAIRSEEYTEDRSLPDRLTAVDKPVLVVFGERDQIYDARDSLSAYAAVPGAETVLIPESGHSPQVEAPAETAQAIRDFMGGLAEAEAARLEAERAREQARRQQARAEARRARTRAARQRQARNPAAPQSPGRARRNQPGN